MVMKYDSIMADWLRGSGEHQPGRARARTAAQPPGPGSNTQGRALHRSAETLQISWRARMETGRNNIRYNARGCPSHHHPAPCVPVLCRSGWWRVMRAGCSWGDRVEYARCSDPKQLLRSGLYQGPSATGRDKLAGLFF